MFKYQLCGVENIHIRYTLAHFTVKCGHIPDHPEIQGEAM